MQARSLWDGILEVLKEKINKQNQKEKKLPTKSIFPVNAVLQKYREKKNARKPKAERTNHPYTHLTEMRVEMKKILIKNTKI